jgi:hypothetical protein
VATPGDNSVALTWDDPRQGDQSPVPPTSYRIRAEAIDDSADVQEITIEAPANTATVTGLRNGRVYAITMIAINPAAGTKFDPHHHQAISVVPAEQEANTVVGVLQKGYLIADRVLRPALVTVSAPK